MWLNAPVKELLLEDGKAVGVLLPNGQKLRADSVIVATGGASYPGTGSTGDGYHFARKAGHTIVNSAAVVDSVGMCRRVCEVLAGIKLKKCIVYHRNNGRKTIGATIWRDAVYSFWHIGPYCVIYQL